VSDAANRRLEHRAAGADANPYLVTAWVLGGMLKGLEERREPRKPLDGNLYRGTATHGEPLPRYWSGALDRFEASAFAHQLLAPELHRLFALVKRHELDEFNRQVTPGEIASLLPAI
jgi:glutamine synthetase